jgi:hypothetical protein
MRKLLSLALVLFGVLSASAQETIDVLGVKGTVKMAGKPVAKGTKLKATDKINFAKGSLLLVNTASLGRLFLQPSTATNTKNDIDVAVSAFIPKTKRNSAKSNFMLASSQEFQNYFSKEKLLIVGAALPVPINVKNYPMNDDSFFYLRYTYKNESVNKKLDNKDSLLLLSKDLIYAADARPVEKISDATNFEIYYYDNIAEESVLITKLSLVFVDDITAKPEVQGVVDLLKASGTTKPDIIKELTSYFYQFYGARPDFDNVNDWVTKNFK